MASLVSIWVHGLMACRVIPLDGPRSHSDHMRADPILRHSDTNRRCRSSRGIVCGQLNSAITQQIGTSAGQTVVKSRWLITFTPSSLSHRWRFQDLCLKSDMVIEECIIYYNGRQTPCPSPKYYQQPHHTSSLSLAYSLLDTL